MCARKIDPNNWIKKKCDGCGIDFKIRTSVIKHKNVEHFYHNRECYVTNSNFAGSRNSRYLSYWRCRRCEKFIPIEKAKMYTTKTGPGRTYPICPDTACGHSKLMTHPRNTRNRRKYLQQIKEIEQVQICANKDIKIEQQQSKKDIFEQWDELQQQNQKQKQILVKVKSK